VKPPPRWPGLLLLAALALHAYAYGRPNLPYMAWSCHVATTCMAIGMLARKRTPVAAAWLFHVSIGFPAWMVELVTTGAKFGAPAIEPGILASSIFVHCLPVIAGALWLRSFGYGMTARIVALAWALQVFMIPISRALLAPVYNVNFAFTVWPAVASLFSRLWVFQTVISLLCLASLVVMATIVNACETRFADSQIRNRKT